MTFLPAEAAELARMFDRDQGSLDIRTITMGVSLLDCSAVDLDKLLVRVKDKIRPHTESFVREAEKLRKEYGIPIANLRIAVTPVSLFAGSRDSEEYVEIAKTLDGIAHDYGIRFIGGYSALVHKGSTDAEEKFLDSIPAALAGTERLCSSVNVASTNAGINMDAVKRMGEIIKRIAETKDKAANCARFVVFANAVEDNPFMPGAFHGVGEPDCVINVGVSGAEVVRKVVEESRKADFVTLAERIKRAAFKVVQAGELIGQSLSALLQVEFGIVDLSLAPKPSKDKKHPERNSVAGIIEAMGIERCGAHGTLAALALLIDAVKKGGAMGTSRMGGLSGAFIPVSEDSAMARAVEEGAVTLERLEAMTAVCSVGLDMIAIPGDTPAETIAAIIADEMAIGIINNKTTSVRIAPVPGMLAGDKVDWSDIDALFGETPIMPVYAAGRSLSSWAFFDRAPKLRRIPRPITSLTN